MVSANFQKLANDDSLHCVCVCVCCVCVVCVCVCVCVLCVCVCVCMCVHIRDHTYLDSEGGRCWRGKGDTIGMELLHRHHIATG